ncbi:NAD(P)H-hydrate dehydratase [bacterium]|nr:NAD(P)H-hydrate dehydratase [bacterium]MCG2677504.1 NAD(P)H-hydrate dehydratase [bacterium]
MRVVTAEEMREIDRKTIASGIPSIELMENAGRAVAKAIKSHYRPLRGKEISIFCGKGNNGGDGLVIARLLAKEKAKIKIFLLTRKKELKKDPKTNLRKALKQKIEVIETDTSQKLKKFRQEIKKSDLIVDAILGTGIKGAPKGLEAKAIKFINSLKKPMVSVDIPSGVEGSTGRVSGEAIRADLTITFGLPKIGLVVYPGAEYVGKLEVAHIGFPKRFLSDKEIKVYLVTKEDISSYLKPRRPDTHKGTYGHLFVIAGSVGMTGAATLTSQAASLCFGALRSGVGLVTLGIPESLNEIMEVKLTEGMTLPLPETKKKTLSLKAKEEILKFSKKADALALGPGLSANKETKQLIRNLIKKISLPMVIDADALNALVGHLSILQSRIQHPGSRIITPHPGEMARLIGKKAKEVQENRIKVAGDFAKKYKVIVVLKGARTVISDPKGNICINPTGNPGMASAGVGDVLTGMIGSFLAQRREPLEAAKMGVYLHGLAGDLAAQEKGEEPLIASDVLEKLPQSFKQVKSNK